LKDWGGKKHLMNPLGTALSDVWRDLPKIEIRDHIVPDFVLNRIKALTGSAGATYLHIVQNNPGLAVDSFASSFSESTRPSSSGEWDTLSSLELNRIYEGDSISFLEKVSALYPDGIFDLAFADPPYNLKKSYGRYDDSLSESGYI